MASNSSDTGTRDTTYNLISIAYHCLQGAETCGIYLEDAEREGNDEIATFLRDTQRMNRECPDRAKQLLKQHFSRT